MLLLAGMLLLSACTTGGETTSSASSEAIDEGETGMRYTLVSVGKPYTASTAANDTYPDLFGQQLTDGQKAPDVGVSYTDVRMVGYTSTCSFDIDLGEDGKNLSAVSARSLDMSQDGVSLATSARFYGSADGSDWEILGRAFFSSTGDRTVSSARLELEEARDFRYVRISVTLKSGSYFFFVDELEVFADIPATEHESTVKAAYESETIDRSAWRALSTGAPSAPVANENVALGASYQFDNCLFDDRAPEDAALLTDGARTGRLFGEPVWVGISGENAPSLTLDLGKSCQNLYSFRLYALGSGGPSVLYPDAVDVYASEDGDTYTLLGRMYAPVACDTYAYTLLLPEYVHARYLRFAFSEAEGYYWLEEIEVLAGLDEVPDDELYPPVSFPVVTEELFWDASEEDYLDMQNLLLGRSQQIAASFYMGMTEHGDETPADTTVLTDGKLASDLYCYGSEWFFHRGGGALDIFYDLEKLSTVSSFRVSLLEQLDWGIARPTHITVFLSEDAENWYPVAIYDRGDEVLHTGATQMSFDLPLETAYAARFVRFRIESGFLFLDELEAYGTKAVTEKTARLVDSGISPVLYYTNEESEQYANTENTPVQARDIVLVYGEKGDENTLLPLVAYLDAEGNIADTLMDGFLYCPTGGLPSGVAPHQESIKTDWDFLFDNTFNGINGFDRLEEVVGTVKQALNQPEYRVQVYITILYPHETVTDFGDVDGDSVTESLATAEGRRKVLEWYLTRCQTEFAARGYENLELGGFYWINEAVTWEYDDTVLIKEIADCVHDAGSYLLWIPYYTANRYFLGYELGFDLISMQPNYAFDLEKPLYRFTTTASRTRRMQMCVEIEHTYQALSDPLYARNYMLYLYYGAVTGYMEDAIHIYYDDLQNFSLMAQSDSALCRMQYDATYAFVKGTLELVPEVREPLSFSASADAVFGGTLGTEGELALYTLAGAPAHGIVSLSSDGGFLYFPDKGYQGEDSFTYTYNNYLGESEVCTVLLTVS